jgi:hypothetical protein
LGAGKQQPIVIDRTGRPTLIVVCCLSQPDRPRIVIEQAASV